MRLKSAVAVLAKATRGLDGVASDLPRLARVVEMRKLGDVLTEQDLNEAADVRKNEAVTDVDDYVTQVRDILNEYSHEVKRLEREVKKKSDAARKEAARQVKIEEAGHVERLAALERSKEQVQAEISAADDDLAAARDALAEERAKREAARAAELEASGRLAESQKAGSSTDAKASERARRIAQKRDKIDALTEREEVQRAEVAALEARVADTKARLAETQEQASKNALSPFKGSRKRRHGEDDAEEATELASINQSIERLRKQAELLSAELDATDAAAEADSALADDAEAAAVRQAELGALEAEIAEANADIELLTGDVLKDATDTKNEVLSHLSVLLRNFAATPTVGSILVRVMSTVVDAPRTQISLENLLTAFPTSAEASEHVVKAVEELVASRLLVRDGDLVSFNVIETAGN